GDVVFGLALVAVVTFVAHLVQLGQVGSGDLVLTLLLGQRLASRLGLAINHVTTTAQLVRSLSVLTWLENEARPLVGASEPVVAPPAELKMGISLRNVSFQYPGRSTPALSGVNLDLRAGQSV